MFFCSFLLMLQPRRKVLLEETLTNQNQLMKKYITRPLPENQVLEEKPQKEFSTKRKKCMKKKMKKKKIIIIIPLINKLKIPRKAAKRAKKNPKNPKNHILQLNKPQLNSSLLTNHPHRAPSKNVTAPLKLAWNPSKMNAKTDSMKTVRPVSAINVEPTARNVPALIAASNVSQDSSECTN